MAADRAMQDDVHVHILEGEQSEADLRDIETCKSVADVLMKHYPGHIWHIEVNSETAGVCNIKLNYPDKLGILPKWGYRLHLHNLNAERIMRAGGEILERYRLARSRATPYAMLDAINNGCDMAGVQR